MGWPEPTGCPTSTLSAPLEWTPCPFLSEKGCWNSIWVSYADLKSGGCASASRVTMLHCLRFPIALPAALAATPCRALLTAPNTLPLILASSLLGGFSRCRFRDILCSRLAARLMDTCRQRQDAHSSWG